MWPMTSAVAIAREPPPAIARLRSAVEQALEGKPEAVELARVIDSLPRLQEGSKT